MPRGVYKRKNGKVGKQHAVTIPLDAVPERPVKVAGRVGKRFAKGPAIILRLQVTPEITLILQREA